MKRLCAFLAFGAIAAAFLHAAPPASVKDVPVYPGATRDAAMEAKFLNELTTQDGYPNSVVGLYTSTAAMEDVLTWYIGKLGAVARKSVSGDPKEDLSAKDVPGTFTPVVYVTGPATLTRPAPSRDEGGSGLVEGVDFNTYFYFSKDDTSAVGYYENKTAQFTAHRKKVDGAYVTTANLQWWRIEPNTDLTWFEIWFYDSSDFAGGGYVQKTEFGISAITTASPKATKAAEDKRIADEKAAEKAKNDATLQQMKSQLSQAVTEPTAADLGIPLYAGATFNGAVSKKTDQGFFQYVWTTDDTPEKVITFYEKATGKKRHSEKALTIVTDRDAKGVAIMVSTMANAGGAFGKGKTLIMMIRQ